MANTTIKLHQTIDAAQESELSEGQRAKFVNEELNREAALRSDRLRQAVKSAGGNEAVATKAGMSKGSLSAYMNGGEWKLSTANSLAGALGVSAVWLVYGQGSSEPDGLHLAVGPEQPFSTLNIRIEWLSSAMEEADRLIEERNLEASYPKKAQLVWVLYEIIGARETALKPVDSSTSATAERKTLS